MKESCKNQSFVGTVNDIVSKNVAIEFFRWSDYTVRNVETKPLVLIFGGKTTNNSELILQIYKLFYG